VSASANVLRRATLAALALLSGCGKPDAGAAPVKPAPGPVPVVTARAERRPVPVELRGIGRVAASASVTVRPQVSGTLLSAAFREGDTVKADQPLFAIDPRPFDQLVAQAQAALERSRAGESQAESAVVRDQAQLANAETELHRYQDLLGSGVATKEQVEGFDTSAQALRATVAADRAAIDTAKAQVTADAAALENARLQRSYSDIRAPLGGRTGARGVDPGNVVIAEQTALVAIARIQPIRVEFSIPESALADIQRRSAEGTLEVSAAPPGASWHEQGALEFVDNQIDPTTGTIQLRATFANAEGRLWPGQFVAAVLVLASDAAVVVPSAAVRLGQHGPQAWVVKEDGAVELRQLSVSREVGDLTVLSKGIEDGERVVVDGQLRLVVGAHAVEAAPDGGKSPAAGAPATAEGSKAVGGR
jgi:multidrug efflux system membrane fusion protein